MKGAKGDVVDSKTDLVKIARLSTQQFLKCRSLGHAWEPEEVVLKTDGGRREFEATWRCLRCDAKRSDTVLARTGDTDSMSYTYPRGYLVRGIGNIEGGRVLFNRAVRISLLERLVQEASYVSRR